MAAPLGRPPGGEGLKEGGGSERTGTDRPAPRLAASEGGRGWGQGGRDGERRPAPLFRGPVRDREGGPLRPGPGRGAPRAGPELVGGGRRQGRGAAAARPRRPD